MRPRPRAPGPTSTGSHTQSPAPQALFQTHSSVQCCPHQALLMPPCRSCLQSDPPMCIPARSAALPGWDGKAETGLRGRGGRGRSRRGHRLLEGNQRAKPRFSMTQSQQGLGGQYAPRQIRGMKDKALRSPLRRFWGGVGVSRLEDDHAQRHMSHSLLEMVQR